jgi:hypothetical protein
MLSPHSLEKTADAPDFNALLNDVSLEAVMPGAAEVHDAASTLQTGTSIYLTDLPNRTEDKLFTERNRHLHARLEAGTACCCA